MALVDQFLNMQCHRAILANVFRTIEADFEEAQKIKAEKSKKKLHM